ncbi:hypothetical protein N0V83_007068 [Neocucurbitaria cava]|uniref:Uncharacterized protein n=1 Tax=Neocucurbitaria cava TaxID=798079 RepID=A0A9W9CKT4_9PLEO|nr:hypothetical protein N0V83_007068 [Neocucurbitaria cava]
MAIQALSALFRLRDLSAIQVPTATAFDLDEGSDFKLEEIERLVRLAAKSITDCPEGKLPKLEDETPQEHSHRAQSVFAEKKAAVSEKLVAALKRKWSINHLALPRAKEFSSYFHMDTVGTQIIDQLNAWRDNKKLVEYLERLSRVLVHQEVIAISTPHYSFAPPPKHDKELDAARYYGSVDIFNAPAPILSHDRK